MEHLRHRADHRPARPARDRSAVEAAPGDEPGVIVLDQQQLGVAARAALAARRCARGRARRRADSGRGARRPAASAPLARPASSGSGTKPDVVDRHRHRDQAEREQQVADRDVRRVLDDHPVPGPQVGLQHPLDPVERAADDGDRGAAAMPSAANDVAASSSSSRVGQLEAAHPQLALEVDPRQRRERAAAAAGVGEPDRRSRRWQRTPVASDRRPRGDARRGRRRRRARAGAGPTRVPRRPSATTSPRWRSVR